MSITKKKYKSTKLDVNAYYLELMSILLNISQPQKLMKKTMLRKRQEALEKKLNCEFIRIIRVSVMLKIMKLVEQKHLLVNLKTGY